MKKEDRQKICKRCGGAYESRHRNSKYCTISCAKKGRPNKLGSEYMDSKNRNRISFVCLNCGNQFIPNEIRRNRPRKFCSISCSKKGTNNPNYTGQNYTYVGLHDAMRKKAKTTGKCEICGESKPLDLANISGKYTMELSDWEWLCRRCHMKKDGRINNLKQFHNEKI